MTHRDSKQGRFLRRQFGETERPLDPETARTLAILALDTYSIARYARSRRMGATGSDGVLTGVGGRSAVWGTDGRSDAASAAFLNGSAAETLDFQEVLIDGRNNGHAAVVIVPAVLALAAAQSVAPDRVLVALRAGFLANLTLARALGRGHRQGDVGFRTTAVVAPIAAAFAGAVLLGASEDAANHAVAITASTLPAGLLAAMSPLAGDFSVDKDLSVGFSARHAVNCVQLARAGATGPADALAGPRGWLASFGFAEADPGALDAPVDEGALQSYALKLYPANFGCQCAIRLAIEAARRVDPHDLAGIVVRVKSSSAESLSTRAIGNHIAARFSLPYAVASAFVRGRSVLEDFEGAGLADPSVLAVMDRITIVADAELEARHRAQGVFPAHLTARRHDGTEVTGTLDSPQEGMAAEALGAAFASKVSSLCPLPEAGTYLGQLAGGQYTDLLHSLSRGKVESNPENEGEDVT